MRHAALSLLSVAFSVFLSPTITAANGSTDFKSASVVTPDSLNAREKKFGQTALMWAAGHPDLARMLLAHGADIKPVTKDWTVEAVVYTPVTLGQRKDGLISVRGLKESDRVVVDGLQRVRAGQEVAPKDVPMPQPTDEGMAAQH